MTLLFRQFHIGNDIISKFVNYYIDLVKFCYTLLPIIIIIILINYYLMMMIINDDDYHHTFDHDIFFFVFVFLFSYFN